MAKAVLVILVFLAVVYVALIQSTCSSNNKAPVSFSSLSTAGKGSKADSLGPEELLLSRHKRDSDQQQQQQQQHLDGVSTDRPKHASVQSESELDLSGNNYQDDIGGHELASQEQDDDAIQLEWVKKRILTSLGIDNPEAIPEPPFTNEERNKLIVEHHRRYNMTPESHVSAPMAN